MNIHLALVAFMLLMSAAPAVNRNEKVCPDCRIESATVLQLVIPESVGGVSGHALAGGLDSAGRIWVMHQGDLPIYFSSEGLFMGRLGRRGQGPAEFASPTRVFSIPGDSVGVIDPGNGRISVWSRDVQFSRSIAMEIPIARLGIETWPTRVLITANALTPARAGWPLHLIDVSTSRVSFLDSFGANDGQLIGGPVGAMALDRRIWREGDHWWIAEVFAPIVRKWTLSPPEVIEERNVAPPAWFGDPLQAFQGGGDLPSRVDGVWFDGSTGYTWLFVRNGDNETFQRALEEVRRGRSAEVGAGRLPSESEIYRTQVLILGSGRALVADIELGGLVVDVLSDGRVLFAQPGNYGLVDLSVRRLRLVSGARKRREDRSDRSS